MIYNKVHLCDTEKTHTFGIKHKLLELSKRLNINKIPKNFYIVF